MVVMYSIKQGRIPSSSKATAPGAMASIVSQNVLEHSTPSPSNVPANKKKIDNKSALLSSFIIPNNNNNNNNSSSSNRDMMIPTSESVTSTSNNRKELGYENGSFAFPEGRVLTKAELRCQLMTLVSVCADRSAVVMTT